VVEVRWTVLAVKDLKNIFDFIALDSKVYAKTQVQHIRNKVAILQNQPLVGRVVPELKNENIREIITGNYRIIYRVISIKKIDILTIYHTSRLFDFKS